MIKLKRKLIIFSTFSLIFIIIGSIIMYKILKPSSKPKELWVLPNVERPYSRFITKETLIKEIRQKHEIIPMEIELKEEVTINNTLFDMEIFKKLQTIHFFGKGIYSIDLSNIKNETLKVDKNKKIVTLEIPKPTIKAITIEDSKTLYESPTLGILRFGDVTLTPKEYEILINQVKERMSSKLMDGEIYDEAISNSENSLVNIISPILSTTDYSSYKIKISFI
ncbi:DUF4230 domain-containing protein [Clostridium hydrogeniformans]|uniref:DUF4230 domain-containing protein n=1 Tax=Clostridium hydrogeniformans TaxID=349933 RepID=UPI00068BAB09|nr:DUF4230 domain-containing protein [Clostridium hydrogeniformans]